MRKRSKLINKIQVDILYFCRRFQHCIVHVVCESKEFEIVGVTSFTQHVHTTTFVVQIGENFTLEEFDGIATTNLFFVVYILNLTIFAKYFIKKITHRVFVIIKRNFVLTLIKLFLGKNSFVSFFSPLIKFTNFIQFFIEFGSHKCCNGL